VPAETQRYKRAYPGLVWRLDDPNGDEQGAHEQNKRADQLLSIEIGITHLQFS
jgi:hypothetical protein